MPTIDTIIQVNVSLAAAGASAPSFSIPLIIGSTNAGWSDYVHTFTSPASMLSDGFTTSAPEYKYAQKLYGQSRQPSEFMVGHRTTPVAQVDTIAVNSLTGVPGHVYSFSLNGVVVAYTSLSGNVQEDILNGLNTALTTAFPASPFVSPPVTGVVTGTGAGALLTLTDAFPGAGFAIAAVNSELTHVAVTPSNGIADDLNKIIAEDNDWYAIALCSNADNDIYQLALAVESLRKIFIAVSSDSAIATNVSTDLLSVLKGKGLKRSALIWSPASANQGIEAGWYGNFLSLTPGSYNPAYMTIVGISPDIISDTQRSILVGDPVAQVAGKNANIYSTVAGLNIMQFAQMVGGQFIDITIGLDWLETNIQIAILNEIYKAAQLGKKIPYTDNGSAVFQGAVKSVLDQGATNGLISTADPITVTAPLVATIPAIQRQNRLGPPVSFQCTLQGAQNSVIVNGTVLI